MLQFDPHSLSWFYYKVLPGAVSGSYNIVIKKRLVCNLCCFLSIKLCLSAPGKAVNIACRFVTLLLQLVVKFSPFPLFHIIALRTEILFILKTKTAHGMTHLENAESSIFNFIDKTALELFDETIKVIHNFFYP